jgi:hypothetical protein
MRDFSRLDRDRSTTLRFPRRDSRDPVEKTSERKGSFDGVYTELVGCARDDRNGVMGSFTSFRPSTMLRLEEMTIKGRDDRG